LRTGEDGGETCEETHHETIRSHAFHGASLLWGAWL